MNSLQELLAEDGFKNRMRPKAGPGPGPGPRILPPSRTVSMPLYPDSNQRHLFGNADSKLERGRSRSDVYSRRSLNKVVGDKRLMSRLGRSFGNRQDAEDFEPSSSIDSEEVEEYGGRIQPQGSDTAEETEEYGGGFRARKSIGVMEIEEYGVNEIQEIEEFEDSHPNNFLGIQRYNKKYANNLFEEMTTVSGKEHNFQGKSSFRDDRRSKRHDDIKKVDSELQGRLSFSDDLRGRRRDDLKKSDSKLALDEAAIWAVVAILTAYVRRFVKDEKFRASIRCSCYSSLGISRANESRHKGGGALASLREAMTTIERVIQEVPNTMNLKKASLKLSVITGLGSKDLKDEHTSGIPNSHLAACAHVYLAVIYKLQKKDKVAAKHLLQVFCDSPNQARTTLLPGLWDHLFFPHLSHLKVWYDKEIESIPRTSSRTKKMKLLDKVYNHTLDMGTYQFAFYYKEWLTEEAEAPELPSIQIPRASLPGILQEDYCPTNSDGISSARMSVSSQPMVSKKLYDSVFSNSTKKMEINNEMESREEEEVEELQLTHHDRRSGSLIREDDKAGDCSPNLEIYTYHVEEDHDAYSQHWNAPFDILQADEGAAKGSRGVDIIELNQLDTECENISSFPAVASSISGLKPAPQTKENELTLKRLAQAAFQPQVEYQSNDVDTVKMRHSANLPVDELYQNNISNTTYTESKLNNGLANTKSHINSYRYSGVESFGNFEDTDQGSLFSSIPKDFICPITGHIFRDPVTLETGQTFERAAVEEWFDKGNRTCPVTGKGLEYLSVPVTNFVLKRMINGWKSECFRNVLAFAMQIAGNTIKDDFKSQDESALFIMEQFLTGFSIEEQLENAKHLISLGGLHFLLQRLELGKLEEKTCVSSLMLSCIKADGSCRNYLAMNIRRPCILELLHSKQVNARTSAILLLIELICLNRRMVITTFVSGLKTEEIVNIMHVLLMYLQSSPSEERVLVAVLLLHLDLMVEPRRYSIYREKAVNSIIMALDCCLSENEVIPNTQRALLILGGHFSSSGEILTEIWLLKQAGFYDGADIVSVENEDDMDETEEEQKEREEWSKNVALVLLGNGEKSFLETLSKCFGSENSELVRACLTTVAWLSHSLASLSISEIQVSAFSTLIPWLKESLEEGQQIEHRVLASLSLLNFSKISECKSILMTLAEEIRKSLKSLVEVTWTAKHMYTTILNEFL